MQITVQGHASAAFPPERATVHITIGFEGAEKGQVVRESTALANDFAEHVDELRQQDDSPVTWAALSALGTRSWRPHSTSGEVMPMRHGASAQAKVKFRDFTALSAFIDQWGGRDGISVNHVQWTLTETRRVREEAAVLARAVDEARQRAQAMATAAGAGAVRFIEIADPGLLSVGREFAGQQAYAMKARGGMHSPDEGVNVSPEDVELDATIQARFTTD